MNVRRQFLIALLTVFSVSLCLFFVVLFLLAPTICIIKALAEIVKRDNKIAKATGKSVYLKYDTDLPICNANYSSSYFFVVVVPSC